MAIEIPTYKVIKTEGKIELREYAGYITASVTIEAKDYSSATNTGFRLVADYIFGNNIKKNKIAMTAPVLQEGKDVSEKIAMTAPVTTIQQKNVYTISFVMPKQYSIETLPVPNNKQVTLKKVPSFKSAVLTFSGFVNEKILEEKKKKLEGWMKKNGLRSTGTIQTARYDPPWTPWFLRRNEVALKLM